MAPHRSWDTRIDATLSSSPPPPLLSPPSPSPATLPPALPTPPTPPRPELLEGASLTRAPTTTGHSSSYNMRCSSVTPVSTSAVWTLLTRVSHCLISPAYCRSRPTRLHRSSTASKSCWPRCMHRFRWSWSTIASSEHRELTSPARSA